MGDLEAPDPPAYVAVCQDVIEGFEPLPCRIPNSMELQTIWTDVSWGVDYSHRLRKLVTRLIRPFNIASGRGFSDTRFRLETVHYKSLNMKQEDIWIPFTNDENSPTLRTVYEIAHTIKHAEAICKHCRWDQELSFFIPAWDSLGCDRENDNRAMTSYSLPIADPAVCGLTQPLNELKISERLQCGLTHKVGCQCPANINSGGIRSCPNCHTDFAFNVVETPGRPDGRCLVFTAWKQLGEGGPDWFWRSHTEEGEPSLRVYHAGFAYDRYELNDSQRSITSHKCIYTPDISVKYTVAAAASRIGRL